MQVSQPGISSVTEWSSSTHLNQEISSAGPYPFLIYS